MARRSFVRLGDQKIMKTKRLNLWHPSGPSMSPSPFCDANNSRRYLDCSCLPWFTIDNWWNMSTMEDRAKIFSGPTSSMACAQITGSSSAPMKHVPHFRLIFWRLVVFVVLQLWFSLTLSLILALSDLNAASKQKGARHGSHEIGVALQSRLGLLLFL